MRQHVPPTQPQLVSRAKFITECMRQRVPTPASRMRLQTRYGCVWLVSEDKCITSIMSNRLAGRTRVSAGFKKQVYNFDSVYRRVGSNACIRDTSAIVLVFF